MRKADGQRFNGICEYGDSFCGDECNTKVVGARYFSSTYESQTPLAQRTDSLSPRDGDGHGTRCVYGGSKAGVAASVGGHSLEISGVAPAAKLAIYKIAFTSAIDAGRRSTPATRWPPSMRPSPTVSM